MNIKVAALLCIVISIACYLIWEGGESSKLKQQILSVLSREYGKDTAEKFFRAWRLEYGLKPGEDDASAYCEILEQIKHGNPSPEAMKRRIENIERKILTATDHHELLDAFRLLMQTRINYPRDAQWHDFGNDPTNEVSFVSPSDPKLPDVIRNLHPDIIICHNQSLEIAFEPGFDSMGLLAYAKGVTNAPTKTSNRSFQKLIDGLWFYEDGAARKGNGRVPASGQNP